MAMFTMPHLHVVVDGVGVVVNGSDGSDVVNGSDGSDVSPTVDICAVKNKFWEKQSSTRWLVILFQIFQDKQKKSNARIEMCG